MVAAGMMLAPVTASAQEVQRGTVQTPYGPAPISFADLVDQVKPAVVSIHVSGRKRRTTSNRQGAPNLPDFFRNLPRNFGNRRPSRPRPSMAQGSGFFVSADGYVVTNNHVIARAGKIMVSQDGREKLEAVLIGADPRTDIALLKVKENRSFPFVKFSEDRVRAGDWALAVGNPFGLGGTVTVGIVSALARDIGSGPYNFIQIDAAVNRGNSGGPTFNLKGEVIGVNTAIYSPSGGNVGIAFAVPAATAASVIRQLRQSGSVKRGWLGVRIQNVDDALAASLGLQKAAGAVVSDLTPGGPAAASGLRAGDAIVAVNDSPIKDSRDLARKIADLPPRSTVQVRVWRNGGFRTIDVRLGTFPTNARQLAAIQRNEPVTTQIDQLGLTLAPVGSNGAAGTGVEVTAVDPNSNAAAKGLKKGDVILRVGDVDVRTASDVRKGIKSVKDAGRGAVLLRVRSGNQTRFVALTFDKG
ncbi:MAG: Do family serine endopeptidase [Pseudomonadota bacterium]